MFTLFADLPTPLAVEDALRAWQTETGDSVGIQPPLRDLQMLDNRYASFDSGQMAPGSEPTIDAVLRTVALTRGGHTVCSGTLVGPHTILTARHCLPAEEVRFGMEADRPWWRYRVTETRPHASLDLALLRIDSSPAWFVHGVIWRTSPGEAAPDGQVLFTGYGAVTADGANGEGKLRRADTRVFDWGCNAGDARRGTCVPGRDAVVRSQTGADTCNGDSGGPLFESMTTDLNAWGFWRLIGVTSRAATPGTAACGGGGVYTRIDQASAWLASTLQHWN